MPHDWPAAFGYGHATPPKHRADDPPLCPACDLPLADTPDEFCTTCDRWMHVDCLQAHANVEWHADDWRHVEVKP